MEEKCFCHLNGYAVKDATARKDIEQLRHKVDTGADTLLALDLVKGELIATTTQLDESAVAVTEQGDLIVKL